LSSLPYRVCDVPLDKLNKFFGLWQYHENERPIYYGNKLKLSTVGSQ